MVTDKRGEESQDQTDKFMSLSRDHLHITQFYELIVIIDQMNIKIIVIKVTDKFIEQLFCFI